MVEVWEICVRYPRQFGDLDGLSESMVSDVCCTPNSRQTLLNRRVYGFISHCHSRLSEGSLFIAISAS